MTLLPLPRVRTFGLALVAGTLGLYGGCDDHDHDHDHDDDHGSTEEEFCEHLENGPAEAKTATLDVTTPPALDEDHIRYDITFVDIADGDGNSLGFGGFVTHASGEERELAVGLSADVPFRIFAPDGTELVAEMTETGSEVCTALAKQYVYDVGVGTYTFDFGPSPATEVRMVFEFLGEHDGHDHD